ncbi:MAG: isoprenylcysteine carboxylmethyltransferase family protein [Anaerolineales bacterium]|jgi:protein-S-isoprenylcysteine O-methyltransferase Ste14
MKIPRWAIPIVWGIIVLVIMILLPWAASLLGPRYGWSQGVAAAWNLIGLAAVVLGLAMYIWCLVFHFRTYREPVNAGFDPPHLVDGGPYRISRNPMYVAGLFVWVGWVVYYGSPAVLIGLLFLWLMFTVRVIPYEERQLEELFGGEYLAYKKSVRRWLGRM